MNIPKKYLIKDPSLLVAGQKLWSALHGEVEFVENTINLYPYTIKIKKNKKELNFTENGMYFQGNLIPTLFLSCPYETNEFPKVMEVWNAGTPEQRVVSFKDQFGWHGYPNIKTMEEYNNIKYPERLFIWQHARDITPVPEVDEMKERTKAIIENIEKELDKLKGSLNK